LLIGFGDEPPKKQNDAAAADAGGGGLIDLDSMLGGGEPS